MYTKNYTLNSLFYNAISASKLDENISLHPDQYKVLNLLENKPGVILSAPTSFGKTFVVFEYIARHLPKTVFLVVPTLALIDEYKRKIIRKYKNKFSSYKIFTTINNETDYSEYEYKMFIGKGLDVTVCDKKSAEDMGELYNELKAIGCKFSLGENYLDAIYEMDIVFRTPGMYYLHPALTKAREMGIAVTSEMEVFFDLCPCRMIGITGTDGKTTTPTIISEMLSRSGKTVHKGGNIGRALLPVIEEIKEEDIAVVELSSFPSFLYLLEVFFDNLLKQFQSSFCSFPFQFQ